MRAPTPLHDYTGWKTDLHHSSLTNLKGQEIFVEPRLLKLWDYLCANPNKVITRNELIEHVWKDVIVSEESLSKAIFDLRKFLAGHFIHVPEIMTIRKVGYKLVVVRPKHRLLRIAVKTLVAIFAFAVTFIILVRALRYENP